jgi:hypothetical protein
VNDERKAIRSEGFEPEDPAVISALSFAGWGAGAFRQWLGLAQSAADYAPRTATDSSADHHRPRPIQERGSLMAVDVWKVKVGDQVREIGSAHALTVWRIDPPGSAGRAHGHGPSINANVRPRGYGVSFDNLTAHQFEEA